MKDARGISVFASAERKPLRSGICFAIFAFSKTLPPSDGGIPNLLRVGNFAKAG